MRNFKKKKLEGNIFWEMGHFEKGEIILEMKKSYRGVEPASTRGKGKELLERRERKAISKRGVLNRIPQKISLCEI